MHDQMEDPFAGESDLYHFITQETRYLILQYVLAHPENLPSLEELDHAIPKGKSTIHEHLGRLRDRGIVDAYELAPERRSRDLPSTFYGLTEYGIHVVEEHGFLDAKGMLQAMYADMNKPERIRRYEDAPRPERKSEDDLREELDELLGGEQTDEPEIVRDAIGIASLLDPERTGPPDGALPLSELVEMSSSELEQAKVKLEGELESLENEMSEHERRYRTLLKKGAESPGGERKTYAQRAKLEKKKYAIKKRTYENQLSRLDAIVDVHTKHEYEDADGRGDGTGDSEEFELIDRIRERQIDPEEIDIEETIDPDAGAGDETIDEGVI